MPMYQTEKTERYDLEESGEFLQAVEDPGRTAQNILDELDYQVGRGEMRIIGVSGFEIAMRCRRWRRCRPGSTLPTQAHTSPTTECHGNSRYP